MQGPILQPGERRQCTARRGLLAYFKDTSAKILRVQVSIVTDAIPQATLQASPRSHARSWPTGGGPLITAQSAAPAAPKQRQKCTRQRKRYTRTPSRAVDTPHARFRGCLGLRMHRWGCPTTGQPCRRAVAVPSPPHNTHARRSDPPRDATRTHRAGRRGKSRKMTTSSRGTPSRRGCWRASASARPRSR